MKYLFKFKWQNIIALHPIISKMFKYVTESKEKKMFKKQKKPC